MTRLWVGALVLACAHAPAGGQGGGEVTLRCTPADAEVAVDGVPRGTCADLGEKRPLRLGEGMHQIDIHKAGYQPYQTYFAPGGASLSLVATLHPLAGAGETP